MCSDTPTLLSINRFEGKKNVGLAVEAFAKVRSEHPKLRLIVAGRSLSYSLPAWQWIEPLSLQVDSILDYPTMSLPSPISKNSLQSTISRSTPTPLLHSPP